MRSNLLNVAWIASTVSAIPLSAWQNSTTTTAATPATTYTALSTSETSFKFPLEDGFPNIQIPSSQLTAIEKIAHGTLPNTPLPSDISPISAATFQLIAFNEIFEVAYFTQLIRNITNNVEGFEIGSNAAKAIILEDLEAIRAQEEIHALGANAILATAGQTTIEPCEYVFPVDNFDDAITLASTFTDVVLGTLQQAIDNFGLDGDTNDFTKLIGGVIGQEGEQNGFFRSLSLEHKIPSALPFLTESAGPFAFSALNQLFVVPGSCPNANVIPIPIFGALNIETSDISDATTSLQFSIQSSSTDASDASGLSIVYINQQNAPVVEPLQNIQANGEQMTFTATFPYAKFEMNGLTIAAITNSTGPFANATEVAASTLYGPGLIDFN